jgi:hypothetical protein
MPGRVRGHWMACKNDEEENNNRHDRTERGNAVTLQSLNGFAALKSSFYL